MRWDHLTRDPDVETANLPGMTDPAVVRRFDAPEALGTRFYEIEARSVLNKVPARTDLPFGWTVNPYRGCSHACTYCLDPATPVLMADGRTKAIGDLGLGDAIYGTRCHGTSRRYVMTTVQDRWATRKPAYAVRLEDGTELVASGDHRFLTTRGWKHVTGTEQGGTRRPHLTPGARLLGPGGHAPVPEHDAEYRRGYLCGMARGNVHVGTYEYDRSGGGRVVHRFPLALADAEALARSRAFLDPLDVPTDEFALSAGTSERRAMRAIRTSRAAAVDRIRGAVSWPDDPSLSWCRGFLAGAFDAEGSGARHVIRISNGDDGFLRRVSEAARALGFDAIREPLRPDGMTCMRLVGGLPERMRFLLAVDPAITRKRDVVGLAVDANAPLRVVEIAPLGVRDLVDITTGTGDFVASGVISHNCFARPTHEYLGFGPGRDFEREIVVKVNAPERLRADLVKRARTPAYGDTVALGTNTDPYQWVEAKYRLMPGIWEALRDARVPGSVLTKSPLLLRDQALMLQVQANAGFEAALSVPSLDTKAWRTTEPHTPHPRARLAAVAELNRIGIPTAVLAAPIMPGINDSPAQIEALLTACTDAGAIGVRGIGLHLRGSTRDVFLEWLADARPDLVDLYAELYRHGPHLPKAEQTRLARLVERGERWGERVVRTERPAPAARFAPGTRALSGGPAEAPARAAPRRPGTRPRPAGSPAGDPTAEDQLSLF